MGPDKLAEAVRAACLKAAVAAHEDAGLRGLCQEGRWEAALGALGSIDLRELVRELEPADDRAAAGHAYVVGNITVRDPQKWAEYRGRVPETLAPWGAELVFRGRQVAAFSGEGPHADIVVIRFPDVGAARAWFSSPAYQALIPLRQEAAAVVLLCYA